MATSNEQDMVETMIVGTLGTALVACAVFGVLAASCFTEGFVLSHLWGWFVVPTFGLRALSWGLASGFATLVQVARPLYRSSDAKVSGTDVFMGIIGQPAIMLAIGWALKTWAL